jgi:hypothetical protein
MNKTSKLCVLAAAAVLSLVAGCQTDSPAQVRRDAFVPEDQPRELRTLMITQEAAGARRDATLHAGDFDNDGVNSLGQQKLDLMLAADEPVDPIVIYIDFAEADVPASAHHSVIDYLKTRGLPEAQVALKDGPNPGAKAPAADSVTALHALAGSGASTGAPAGASGAAGGAAPAAAGAAPTGGMGGH